MPHETEPKSSLTNWDIFKFYFPLFALGSFLFFLYQWYMGYLILSGFPFVAMLQCALFSCVIGILGSFYKIAAKKSLPDYDEDTLLTRALRYLLIGVFLPPIVMAFFMIDGKRDAEDANRNSFGMLILWPFLVLLFAFAATLKVWTWGRIPDERERRESRKQRERALREARRIEREDL
jgi:hypothetical protein